MQIVYPRPTGLASDLRTRKKEKLRLAVQDAALELFSRQGFEATTVEQIAAQAETSVSTFFRYFRSKADVLSDDDGSELRLRAVHEKICQRPDGESEIVAVCQAILQAWVHPDEPERSMRMAAVVESSTLLLGLRHEIIENWVDAITYALAARANQGPSTRRQAMIARLVVSVFCDSVQTWLDNGCDAELRQMVIADFELLLGLKGDMTRVDHWA